MEELKSEVSGGVQAYLSESNDGSEYAFGCRELFIDDDKLEDLISKAEENGIVINRMGLTESNYGDLCFTIYKEQLDGFKDFCREHDIDLKGVLRRRKPI